MVICLALAAISITIRIPDFENTDFHNSDATWHVLHTLRCYEQTPVSIHKFLPIVTLGGEDDKFITWGATIPDKYGNYYYTSFSPAGFVAPYLFMKLFNVPASLMGLYVFNSMLCILCFLLSARLFAKLFADIDERYIWLFTAVIYLFQPEIMQGQGIVYWSQSLYQLIFLAQLNLLFTEKSRKSFALLLLMCMIGAYTEWTGYCANIGIAVALFFMNEGKARYVKAAGVIAATGLAFVQFCAHYLSVVSLKDFAWALSVRFAARNFAAPGPLWHLGAGYVISFALFGFVVFCLLLFCLLNKQRRTYLLRNLNDQKYVLIVLLFALVENVIMKQHAVAYSFDRMKFVFPLMILFFSEIESVKGGGGIKFSSFCFSVP
jgi:hypothetical protein